MTRLRYRVDFSGHFWFFDQNELDKVKQAVDELKTVKPEVFKIIEYLDQNGKVALTKSVRVKEEEL